MKTNVSARHRVVYAVTLALLTAGLLSSCAISPKTRTQTARVPPVVTIGVQPLPLSAALVMPEVLRTAVYRDQLWCGFSTMNLTVHVGPAFEKSALQALPQALQTIEVVRDKNAVEPYDVLVEPSAPDIKLSTKCNWLPWERATQEAKVLLHLVVTARTGEVLLDKTYASQPHVKESAADAIGDAYAEILETMVHHLASAPRMQAYAKALPSHASQATGLETAADHEVTGLGFAAGFGYVVTSYHVVAGLPQLHVFVQDTVAPATVALRDRTNDVALLRVELDGQLRNGARPLPALTGLRLGDASKVKAGDRVWTLALTSGNGEQASVTEGSIVAASGPGGDRRFFQIALALPPGNSGSPLINEHGEVIGLMLSTVETANGSGGANDLPRTVTLAIKISYAKTLLGMLPESEFMTPSADPLPAQPLTALADLVRPQVVMITGSQ